MEPEKIDRRVRRTKKLLLQGLTQLMSEKKINKITVKELTDLIDVNRATFYLYYKDIFDMVEKIETEMFDNFNETYSKFTKSELTYDEMLQFVTFVFDFVQEYAEMCKILLGPDGDYAFIEKFKIAIDNSSPFSDHNADKEKSIYFMPFIISGSIGIIQKWLEDGMKTSSREMADIVVGMITSLPFMQIDNNR